MAKNYVPKQKSDVREWIECIAIALMLALVIKFFMFEIFRIPSGSMRPTLFGANDRGDRILVNRLAYSLGGQPSRWDIMVFISPLPEHNHFIKRVVGLPGETIQIKNGDIYIDDKIATKPLKIIKEMRRRIYSEDFNAERDNCLSVADTGNAEMGLTAWVADKSCWKIARNQLYVDSAERSEISFCRPISDFQIAFIEKGTFYIPFYNIIKRSLNIFEKSPQAFDSNFLAYKIKGYCPSCDKEYTAQMKDFVFMPYLNGWPNAEGGVLYTVCPLCGHAELIGYTYQQPAISPEKEKKTEPLTKLKHIRTDILPANFYEDSGTTWQGTFFQDIMAEFNLRPASDAGIVEIIIDKNCIIGLPINQPLNKGYIKFENDVYPISSTMTLEKDKDYKIEAGYIDHTILLYINGSEIMLEHDKVFSSGKTAGSFSLAMTGGSAYFDNVNLFTDIYYHNTGYLGSSDDYVKLSPEEYFMLGDNSRNSHDSRGWGPLNKKTEKGGNAIVGKALFVWWPLSHAKKIY